MRETRVLTATMPMERNGVRPKIGFVGVGWIGKHRMKAIVDQQMCEVVGIVEPQQELAKSACELIHQGAAICSFDELLASGLDGMVIATPSALHAKQAIAAFERGISVFCQKPLGRNLAETREVVEAARSADRLLCADFSYRFVGGIQQIRELVQSGSLGEIYFAELKFHNAYGPDKAWFYDPKQSGGGCLIDLGIHLVDLILWILNFPSVHNVCGHLFCMGRPFEGREREVEDYATASLELEGNTIAQLACSWKAHAGQDAVIEASFYGTQGGAQLRNVNGSFFDFVTERFRGTQRERLSEPPESWGGRAAVAWANQLTQSSRFDPAAENLLLVADTLDRIYAS